MRQHIKNIKDNSNKTYKKSILVLALASVVAYILEMSMGYSNSLESPFGFIVFERFVATVLTIEIIYRLIHGDYKQKIWGIPLFLIDIISILPFFLGFFVPTSMLGTIRSLRVFRVLKLLRYSRSLQLVYLSFYRSWNQLKPILISWLIVVIFSATTIHQIEKNTQKEFDNTLNCVYFSFITASTIGYGDLYPKTDTGKLATMATSIVSLLLFAGMVGVVGSSIQKVMEEEEDETIDPLT